MRTQFGSRPAENWKSQLGKARWPLGIPLVAAAFTALAVSTISPSVGGTGDGNICGKTAADALAGCQTSA